MSNEEAKYFLDNLEVVFNNGVPEVSFKDNANLTFLKEPDNKHDIRNYICWGMNSALYKVFSYFDRTIGIEVCADTSNTVRIFFTEFINSMCYRNGSYTVEAKKGELYAQ